MGATINKNKSLFDNSTIVVEAECDEYPVSPGRSGRALMSRAAPHNVNWF